jgi:tetratricopeptide (TPR) repeat protein
LAWAYFVDDDRGWTDDPQATLDKALDAARRGVAVNPASHSNHLALGQIHLVRGEYDRAVRSFERGIEANPNDADGYAFLAHALCYIGDGERALALMKQALTRNPNLTPWMRGVFVAANFTMRRYDEAVAAMESIENPPPFFYRWYIAALGYIGEPERAKEAYDHYRTIFRDVALTDAISRDRFKDQAALEHYLEGVRLSGVE